MKRFGFLVGLGIFLAANGVEGKGNSTPKGKSKILKPKVISWHLTAEYPHDSNGFTQGFEVWDKDYFLESTGHYGRSELRLVDRKSGNVAFKKNLDHKYFAEGVTRLKNEILQLTWKEGVILRWLFKEKSGFELTSSSPWSGEAWGLTKGRGSLWISDGSSLLHELDQKNLKKIRSIKVTLLGEEFDKLNELEFIEGKIFANVFMSSTVVVINPRSGVIEGMLDVSSLVPKPRSFEAVTNGLAWDQSKKRLYVTGKYWPKVFELRLDL